MTIYQCNAFNSIKTQKIAFSLIFRKSLKMISLKFKHSFEFPFKLHSTFMSKHSFKSMNKTLSINLMNVFLVEIEWLFIPKYFRENSRTHHKKCISFHFNGKKIYFIQFCLHICCINYDQRILIGISVFHMAITSIWVTLQFQ